MFLFESISDEAVLQNIRSWGYDLLENLICSYKILIKLSWKISSVLMVFFFLMENYMGFCTILKTLSRKILSVLTLFFLLWKIVCACGVLRKFERKLLLEHIKISQLPKYHKNRWNFPRDFSISNKKKVLRNLYVF